MFGGDIVGSRLGNNELVGRLGVLRTKMRLAHLETVTPDIGRWTKCGQLEKNAYREISTENLK